jgi:small-conductance mechanosensitive channel
MFSPLALIAPAAASVAALAPAPTAARQHAHALTSTELAELWQQLLQPTALLEAAALVACLALSWLLVRFWRGRDTGGAAPLAPVTASIWFGRHIYDGVLFPMLALGLALIARRALFGMVPLVVFKLVLPILVSLALIRLTVKVLRAVFPASYTVQAIERTVSWLAWIATVLWVTGVLPLVLEELDDITWKVGASTLSLRNVIEGTLSAVLVMILSLSLSSAIEARLLRGATDNLSLRKIAANLIRAMLLVLGLMLALSAVGVDLTALSVLGGGLGVGLGLGLQRLAANYVSGFVILAERSLRIGDLVKVDNFEGRITDINTRYTVLRSATGRESIVPNEILISQRVENASLADNKLLLTTVLQVAYGTDLDRITPLLQEAVAKVPRIDATSPPAVHLSNFAADGLELTIAFWVLDPENGQLNVRSGVNRAILDTLNREGVDLPFPQRVIHVQAPTAAAGSQPA